MKNLEGDFGKRMCKEKELESHVVLKQFPIS